jgi:hypothetical protein
VAEIALSSKTAKAFDARVRVPGDQEGLYLVVAEAGKLPRLLSEVRGRPVVVLGDRRVLALMTMASSSTLSRHPQVRLCGPVSVDAGRFGLFVETIGLGRPP